MIINKLPVIGICRGMQLIHHYLGGDITNGNDSFVNEHRATKHKVRIKNEIMERAKIDLSSNVKKLLSALENRLNGEVYPGFNVNSKLDLLRVNKIILGPSKLYVRTNITGKVNLDIH